MIQSIKTLQGHTERIWHACWSPNGKAIVSCGEDKIIRIWCGTDSLIGGDKYIESMKPICTLEEGQSRTIRCCEWSPNGKMIASASFDGTVVVWHTQDDSMLFWDQIASLEGHDNEVKSVCWNHDGKFLATCGRDKKIWIWEKIPGGDFECVAMLEKHTQDVKFVKWHPSSDVLFSCGYDDTIKVFVEDDDDWVCAQTLVGHTSTVWGLSVSSDGRHLVSCSDDKTIILWESDTSDINIKTVWYQLSKLNNVHLDPIYSIDWNQQQNNNFIISGGGDNTINLIKYESNCGEKHIEVNNNYLNSHDGDVNCVRWNPSDNSEFSNLFLSVGDDCLIKIWKCSFCTE